MPSYVNTCYSIAGARTGASRSPPSTSWAPTARSRASPTPAVLRRWTPRVATARGGVRVQLVQKHRPRHLHVNRRRVPPRRHPRGPGSVPGAFGPLFCLGAGIDPAPRPKHGGCRSPGPRVYSRSFAASSAPAPAPMSDILDQLRKRRTFAIISHPDAGKTTLTEKLLLYGGAIQLAGHGEGPQEPRSHATSDWMEMEKQRGISITSSVMQFPYGDCDRQPARHPGPRGLLRGHLPHPDRRRLRRDGDRRGQGRGGADHQAHRRSAGCATSPSSPSSTSWTGRRETPSSCSTRSSRCSGIHAPRSPGPSARASASRGSTTCATTAPISSAPSTGAYRRGRGDRGDRQPALDEVLSDQARELRDEMELVEGASHPFDLDAYRAGRLTPVFFGCAINNFGVRELLDAFVDYAPPPRPRAAAASGWWSPPRSASPASSSRSRRTWTRTTATASPSCASARAATPRA